MLSQQTMYPAHMNIVFFDEVATVGINMFAQSWTCKSRFHHCDNKLPEVDLWPHKCDRGSHAYAYAWVTWIYYATKRCIFSENQDWPLTPGWPLTP